MFDTLNLDPSVVDTFQNVNIVRVKKISGPFYDKHGSMKEEILQGNIKGLNQAVSSLLDEPEISADKWENGKLVNMESFIQFLTNCVDKVNGLNYLRVTESSDVASAPQAATEGYPEEQHEDELEDVVVKNDNKDGSLKIKPLLSEDGGINPILPNNAANGLEEPWEVIDKPEETTVVKNEMRKLKEEVEEIRKLLTTKEERLAILKAAEKTPGHHKKHENQAAISNVSKEEQPIVADQHQPNPQEDTSTLKDADYKDVVHDAEEDANQLQLKQYQEMQEMLRNTASHLMKNVYLASHHWMNTQLSQGNIFDIELIYELVLQQVLAQKHPQIDSQLFTELRHIVDNECKLPIETCLSQVAKRLEAFNSSIVRTFNDNLYLAHNQLDEILKQAYTNVSLHLPNQELQDLIKSGCEKLMGIFFDQNRILAEVTNDILTFYNVELSQLLEAEVVCSPTRLKLFHSSIVSKLTESFCNAFESVSLAREGSLFANMDRKVSTLTELLNNAFLPHMNRNIEILKRLQGELSKIIKKAKSSYVENIEKVLDQNEKGLEVEELRKMNDEIVQDVIEFVSNEINEKVRQNEPFKYHLESLQFYIDDYYPSVEEENDKRLEKYGRPKNISSKVDVVHPKNPSWKDAPKPITNVVEIEISRTLQTPITKSKVLEPVNLPPLVFQLQSKQIKMGMQDDNGFPIILKNESGDESTSLLMGLHTSGNFSYGKNTQCAINKGDPSLKQHWWISDTFAGKKIWKDSIRLENGDVHEITVEFLLGFILKSLKEYVETGVMEGVCSTTIITVPFWFSSTQRSQVQTSAKLAGFSKVYLINEASSAAHACANTKSRLEPPKNILIFSENSEMIDATIYSYTASVGKVTMLGHCGSYCLEEKGKGYGIIQEGVLKLVNLPSTVLSFLVGGSNSPKEDEKISMLRSVCMRAIQNAFGSNENMKEGGNLSWEVFVISENDSWKEVLNQVCMEKAEKVCYLKDEYASVFGAVSLSDNPEEIRQKISDKTGFDIMHKHVGGTEKTVRIPRNPLPLEDIRIKLSFAENKNKAIFYQLQGRTIVLGSLAINNFSGSTEIEAHFQVDYEGLVELVKVAPTSRRKSNFEYVWTTASLSKEKFVVYLSLLEFLLGKQKLGESLKKDKQELLMKCEKIKALVEQRETYKFPRAASRKMFLQKVTEVEKIAMNLNVTTLDQMRKEVEGLESSLLQLKK